MPEAAINLSLLVTVSRVHRQHMLVAAALSVTGIRSIRVQTYGDLWQFG